MSEQSKPIEKGDTFECIAYGKCCVLDVLVSTTTGDRCYRIEDEDGVRYLADEKELRETICNPTKP